MCPARQADVIPLVSYHVPPTYCSSETVFLTVGYLSYFVYPPTMDGYKVPDWEIGLTTTYNQARLDEFSSYVHASALQLWICGAEAGEGFPIYRGWAQIEVTSSL